MTIKGFVLALATVLVPALTLSSCGDDEENNGGEDIVEIRPIDGVKFVKNNWMLSDANGNFVSFAQGRALNEAEPTVAYVGVKDMDEAKENFADHLVPRDAKRVETADNITVTLTDTLGKEQNKVFFTAVDDGETIATVKLEKKVGIEKYVTEYRYIDKRLWPENSVTDDDFPFQEGGVYSNDGRNYVCIKVPEAGQNGILFTDWDETTFYGQIILTRSFAEVFFPQFPPLSAFEAVDKKLLGDEGDKYLKLLNACSPDYRGIDSRPYWTSSCDYHREAYLYSLTTHKKIQYNIYNDRYELYAKAEACDIIVSGSKVIVSKIDQRPKHYEYRITTTADDWPRNTTLEEQALSK